MGAPIVVGQRTDPWEQLLPQLFMYKMQHKMNLEEMEAKAKLKEKEAKTKITRGTAYKGEKGHMRTPVYMGDILIGEEIGGKFYQKPEVPYKEGELKDFKIGDEIIQHKYEKGKWVSTGVKAPRYKLGVTVNLTQSSPTERENLATGEATLSTLDNLYNLFNESYVGPVAGRIGRVKDIFGGNEEKQSEFYAATHAFKNQIIKEITGAQMSEVEAKRIMKQIPDVNDPPSVWKAKWKQSKRNISVLRRKRLEIMKKSGVRTPEDTQQYDFEYIPGQGLVPAGGK
ncbi:MAG: hypothetical protein ACFFCW_00415 [Candidatus Hodarchaeota archaeon]